MPDRTPTRRHRSTRAVRRAAAAVEALEPRQYLALFLNNIDSENLGKGMWAWTIQGSSGGMQRDGFSDTNYSGWMNYLKNTQHLDYVIIKAGSGNSLLSQYNSSLVNAAHAAGIKIFPYFYIYGDVPDGGGTHSSTAEANVFNTVFGAGGAGGDAAIFDIESEYGDNDSAGLINYFNLIGKSQSGNGSGSRDRLFMAYSTFDILHFHYTQLPTATIADYTDAAMPQMYWAAHGYTIANDLSQVDADYKNTTYVGVNGVKPVIPTGQTYDSGNGNPTGAQTDAWLAAIKADTSAVGGTGAPAGWRYKSVNYFDERTLDRDVNGALLPTAPAQRNAVAAQDIGDLPGTPAVTSPANNATNQPGTGLVLDWGDVVNTYGSGSVGAAMYYDVYVDNMSTPMATISYTAPNKPASTYTVPGTLAPGSHTWKIVARNMFGSTSSPVWNFAVGLIAPTIPTNPTPADNASVSASPTLLDWDSNFASSYDVTLDGVFQANVASSQYTIGSTLALGTHTWQITAKNSAGNTPGPTWTFNIVPKVSNVTSTAANGTYTTGATIPISVVFNANVNVTGTPLLALNSGGSASYVSGSGTNTLIFNYVVAGGQNASDLDYSSTSSLTLNGGTIKDGSNNNVGLTLVAPGAVGSLGANKNIVVDSTGPAVTNISSTLANGTYAVGQVIPIQITFNEAAIVTGSPQLALAGGGVATYASGSGTATLVFNYTVAAGQNSADLDESSSSALSLNGGTIKDAIGNNAGLTLPAPQATGSLGANKAIVVDTAAPTVANVTSSTANGTYANGALITIQVVFSEIVTVTGTPKLALNSGATVNYTSGSGTNTLTFNYTVATGQNSSDLDYSSTSALTLNGGTIRDVAANNANLTLASPGAAGSLGANKNIIVNTSVPGIVNVTSSTANGIYKTGTISIQVVFSEVVNVTGSPSISLNSGGIAAFFSGNGSTTLNFNYFIANGQTSFDLDYVSISAFNLNGGTVRDAATNNANLTLPVPGTTGSLSFNKDIVVDTVQPTILNMTSTAPDGTYAPGAVIPITAQFSEPVVVTGTPKLNINTGVMVDYSSGSGTDTLTFNYTVLAGQSAADLSYVAINSMGGGTIRDPAQNTASRQMAAPGDPGSLSYNKDIVIDGVAPVPTITQDPGQTDPTGSVPINFTVTFSEAVIGFDSNDIVLSGSASAATADVTQTGPTTYNVAVTDLGGDGSVIVTIPANAAVDGVGNQSTASVNTDNTVTFDIPPSVEAVSSPTADGSYKAGDVVTVTVDFDQPVFVTGTPQLALNTGGIASYSGGSGTGTLSFTYTVGAGENSNDLDYISTSALSLNGGSIQDATAHDGILTLVAPGTPSSLGASKDLIIDNAGPTAAVGPEQPVDGSAFLDFTVTYSDATGVDTLTFDGGDITVTGPGGYNQNASFISSVGNVATYRIPGPGGTWDQGDNGSYSVSLNGLQIADTLGNVSAGGPAGSITCYIAPPNWAWMSGSILYVQFDGTTTPITLNTAGSDITATRSATTLNFSGVTSISVLGTPNDDALQIYGSVTPALSFSNGNGHDSMEVMGGTYTFAADLAPALANIDVIVDAAAGAVFDSSQHIGALTANGPVSVTPGGAKVLVLKGLTIGAAGKLDLGDNDLVVDYGTTSPLGSLTGGAYNGIAGLIATGRNGANWNGLGGIGTSSATGVNALAVAEASELLGGSGGMFGTESVDGTAVLVKFTYAGDANLDGKVNIDDYTRIDSGVAASINMWSNGDFNFDGKINIDDYVLIDGTIGVQGLPL